VQIQKYLLLGLLTLSRIFTADFSSLENTAVLSDSKAHEFDIETLEKLNESMKNLDQLFSKQKAIFQWRRAEEFQKSVGFVSERMSFYANSAIQTLTSINHPAAGNLSKHLQEFSNRAGEWDWIASIWYSKVYPAYRNFLILIKKHGYQFSLLSVAEVSKNTALLRIAELRDSRDFKQDEFQVSMREIVELLQLERDSDLLHLWQLLAAEVTQDDIVIRRIVSDSLIELLILTTQGTM